MSAQPLGKLWICLRLNEEELRDCGSRLSYQQQIIFKIIEQFGFNQAVFIQPKQTEGLGCIPIVQRHLHQLVHLNYTSEYLIIQGVPEVREERLYRYNWSEGYSIRAITFTAKGRTNHW
jgi:hypothetical protein